jgi:GDPmannose 4,6-dehydratase
MWLMLQADEPDDYVVATGQAHTVEEFVVAAVEYVGRDWREHIRYDESLSRGPSDSPALVGDHTKIREQLGWEPEVRFDDLVKMLVDADVEELRDQTAKAHQP